MPATLALVADLYPPHRRGMPLGVVGAVQEIGSVLGPLYGAVVLALGSWRAIFLVNLAVGLVLAAVLHHRGAQVLPWCPTRRGRAGVRTSWGWCSSHWCCPVCCW